MQKLNLQLQKWHHLFAVVPRGDGRECVVQSVLKNISFFFLLSEKGNF